MSTYENIAAIERVSQKLKNVAIQLNYEGDLLKILNDPKTALLGNEERAKLNSALAKELQNIIDKNTPGNTISTVDSSREITANLPQAVSIQEDEAFKYFENHKEEDNIKVLNHIKNLREQGKIIYEDLGGGKYAVIMSFGNQKLKMYFPAYTKISDCNEDYIYWDRDTGIGNEETSILALQAVGKKLLKKKEEKGKILLSEHIFSKLIQSLYPKGTEKEQILAFMLATGFYGTMCLSDTNKKDGSQHSVKCTESSREFKIQTQNNDDSISLVFSTFIK